MNILDNLLNNSKAGSTAVETVVNELAINNAFQGYAEVGLKLAAENFSTTASEADKMAVGTALQAGIQALRGAMEQNRDALRGGKSVSMALESWRVKDGNAEVLGSADAVTPSMVAAALAGLTASAAVQSKTSLLSRRNLSMESLAARYAGKTITAVADSTGFQQPSADHLALAQEAFNRPNGEGLANHVIYNQAYNFLAIGNDEAIESVYPTLVIPADQTGIGIEATVMTIFNGVKHTAKTTADDFKKKLLVRSRRNPQLLHNNSTTVVPEYTAQKASHFVDSAKFPVRTVKLDNVDVTTNLLRPGQDHGLLYLSNVEALLGGGVMTEKDSLEPAVLLAKVGLHMGDVSLVHDTTNVVGAQFTKNQQGNEQERIINAVIENLVIDKNTKDAAGAALPTAWLTALGDRKLVLGFEVTGRVNIESGMVSGNLAKRPRIVNLIDVDNKALATTDAAYVALKALVDDINVEEGFGFEVQAYRSNSTFRQAGQLVDRMRFTQLYDVPLRAPISVQTTVDNTAAVAENVTTLLATTKNRLAGEMVTELFNHLNAIEGYQKVPLTLGDIPAILGAGRFSLLPYFKREEIDVSGAQSLDETDRRQNISSRIVNVLKDNVYLAYQRSEFQAAADQKFGGVAPKPTVVLLTDVVTASYITIPGDTRTMGDHFDFRVVTMLDHRLDGKIIAVFNYLDGSQNAGVNELNFGNCIWSAEQVFAANMTIDGQTFHRASVQPRYRFINHAPVAMEFDVKGLTAALGAPFYTKDL